MAMRIFVWSLLMLWTFPLLGQTWSVKFERPEAVNYNIYAAVDKIFLPNEAVLINAYVDKEKVKGKEIVRGSIFSFNIYNIGGASSLGDNDTGEGLTNSDDDYLFTEGIFIEDFGDIKTSGLDCTCRLPGISEGLVFPYCLADFLSPGGLPRIHPQNFTGEDDNIIARYHLLHLWLGFPDLDFLTMIEGEPKVFGCSTAKLAVYAPDDCGDPLFSGIGTAYANDTRPIFTKVTRTSMNTWEIDVNQAIWIIEYGYELRPYLRGKKTYYACRTCLTMGDIATTPVRFKMIWTRQ